MKKLISKIKSMLSKEKSDFKIEKRFIKSDMIIKDEFNIPMGTTHGDRKRYFSNYNSELLNRISEIKSSM